MTSPFRTTTDALRAIMDAYGLTRGDVCRILGLKPRPNGGSSGTVDSWLAGTRGVPRAKLELIMLKAPTYVKPESPRARKLKTLDAASGANIE